jgi:hypothetical protein
MPFTIRMSQLVSTHFSITAARFLEIKTMPSEIWL